MGSHRPIFLVGGKWSERPPELEKSVAKGGQNTGDEKNGRDKVLRLHDLIHGL